MRYLHKLHNIVMIGLVIGGLTACQDQPKQEKIPLGEARPANAPPGVKWLAESPRYNQMREKAYAEGTDFKAKLDFSALQKSNKNLYQIHTNADLQNSRTQAFQRWLIEVKDAQGNLVKDAYLSVGATMPQHGHGMVTKPFATAIKSKPGLYEIEGLQYSMAGWWNISIFVSANKVSDTVVFNVWAQ